MKINSKVQRVIAEEAISLPELEEMLHLAAITSQQGMNRRYYHWLFKVQGDQVLDMRTITRLQVGKGTLPQTKLHHECDGHGCKACGWAGIATYLRPSRHESLPMRLRAS
jgi:hypothetical protein